MTSRAQDSMLAMTVSWGKPPTGRNQPKDLAGARITVAR
jgi:hypothetical protein